MEDIEKIVAEKKGKVDVTSIATFFRNEIREQVTKGSMKPRMVAFLTTDDAGAIEYAKWTRIACTKDGIEFILKKIERVDLEDAIIEANNDVDVHGIMIYYPVFGGMLDAYLQDVVSPCKDVEGMSTTNRFNLYHNIRFLDQQETKKCVIPCTPLAMVKIIDHMGIYDRSLPFGEHLKGKIVTIVNRSEIVGRPLAAMLANDGAYVYSIDLSGIIIFQAGKRQGTIKMSETTISKEEAIQKSDILILGVPSPKYKVDESLIREGAVVINFAGCLNVEESVESKCLLVPNIGKVTITILILMGERVARAVIYVVLSIVPFSSYIELMWPKRAPYTESEKDIERDAIEMITSRGYPVEEHFVTTEDGFVLGLHRITGPRAFTSPPASPPASPRDLGSSGFINGAPKPAVLIMHGFMQTSEAWLCRTDPQQSLPFILADAGYDVWLGNNRGNKYSYKHTTYTPNQERFWNWSLDELVRYDLPSFVDFITERTRLPSISYIGFSQGTAQGWASLSTNTSLANKINLFIALAPVATVKGFSNPMIDSLARSRPDFLYLLFGKKSMLPSTIFWRNLLPKDVFVYAIDMSVRFLFGWTTENIAEEEKAMLYSHIFSYTSVKSVVHWFQIIQTNRFQMFDDMLLGITPNENSNKPHRYHGRVIPAYHPGQILTKCALFYGGADTLPNTKALLSHLPRDRVVLVHEEEKYEHLDFMWGKDANKKVFSKIVQLLRSTEKTVLSESESE
eukprot:gene1111-1269_t